MKKTEKNKDKGNRISRGVRLDPDTDAMITEVAKAENRNISNSIIRLARIGHRCWKKSQKNIASI